MDLNKMRAAINGLKTVSEEERALLDAEFQALEKEAIRDDFKLRRLQKDKSIVVNILNETISDLEKNQLITQKANQKLFEQKKALRQQKKIIEKNAVLLEQNLVKLEHSYKELEEFSYIVSHDLKSPLRTISSFAQLIKNRYYDQLDEEVNEFIDFIVAGVFQMDKVIYALLEYSKVGNPSETFSWTNLNQIIDVVKLNLRKQIKDNRATIISDDLPVICGNKIGFIQLFQNLISNAIKFRSEVDPLIHISCDQKDEKWIFRLKDNGIGIDSEFYDTVFSPFQRLDKRKAPGMGIGLAICKKVVKMHQGDIYIEAGKNGGSSFVFSLVSQSQAVGEAAI